MLKYVTIKLRVYIEPTVVSHLVARPSNDPILASWQQASLRLWEDYADRFEFVISDVVIAEIQKDTQMKEKDTREKHPEFDPETYTNPILEECYRIKAEISAQFKTQAEFSAYLQVLQEEGKRNGLKYVSYYDPSKHTTTKI